MSLTLPAAGITPGASADRRTQSVDIGAEVASFGAMAQRVGFALQDEQDDRLFAQVQLRMLEQFNALEIEAAQTGDPDALDAMFSTRAPSALNGTRPAAVPILDAAIEGLPADALARLQPRLGETYERLRIGAAQGAGRAALALRQSARVETLDRYHDVSLGAATRPGASPEMVLAGLEAYTQQLDALVANGTITPEQRGNRIQAWERAEARTRLESLPPAEALAQIDTDAFAALDPVYRAAERERLRGALDTATREESNRLARAAREGTRVLRAGYDLADADALAATPGLEALPEGREFLAALDLHRNRPDLARLTPDQWQAELARLDATPIAPGDEYQIENRAAVRAMAEANIEAWNTDPIGHLARLGWREVAPMPDPATAAPEDLIAWGQGRLAQAQALVQAGYTSRPVLLRPDERAALAPVTGIEANPADRARIAGSLSAALGDEAPALIGQFSEDPVFGFVGGMVSVTGNTRLAEQIFEGQRALADSDVPLPSEAARRSVWFGEFGGEGGVLTQFADGGLRNQIIAAADALATLRLRGGDPAEQDAETLRQTWLQAAHEVMGGTGQYGGTDARGGVQSLNGAMTLMPMNVNAAEVQSQLTRLSRGLQIYSAPFSGGVQGPTDQAVRALSDISLSGRPPSLGGEPMDGPTLRSLIFQAEPNGAYSAWLDGQPLQIMDDQGDPWLIDMQALLEWQP